MAYRDLPVVHPENFTDGIDGILTMMFCASAGSTVEVLRFQVRLRRTARVTLLFAFLWTAALAVIPSEREIPDDEADAREMVAAGTLDSALWRQLRPLYRKPVNVPTGELTLLYDVFPELEGYAPVNRSELDRYQPWDERSVRRFFEEYPLLRRFVPLLRFNRRPGTGRVGSVGLNMVQLTDDSSAAHSLDVTAGTAQLAHFRGSVEFTQDYIRWARRELVITPVPALTAYAGNVTLFNDKGLVYGAFSPDSADDIRSNWLYGEAATWNGAGIRGTLPAMAGGALVPFASSFLHCRPAELVAGGSVGLMQQKMFTASVGITRLTDPGSSSVSPSVYAHGSLKLHFRGFDSELDCGIERTPSIRVPFSWKSSFRRDDLSVYCTVVRLPQNYAAPLSRLRKTFLDEMDFGDTMQSAVTFVRFSSEKSTRSTFVCTPQVDLWFGNAGVHHGAVQLKGSAAVGRLSATLLLSRELHVDDDAVSPAMISGSLDYAITSALSCAVDQRFSVDREARRSYRCRVAPSLLLFGSNRLEPFAAVATRWDRFSSFSFGILQRTTLFQRTYTEFIFEKQVSSQQPEGWLRVEGRISFYF